MNFAIVYLALSSIAMTQAPPSGSPTSASLQTAPEPSPPFDRPVSWKQIVPNFLDDQKQIWTFPARLTQRRNWIPTVAILGSTAALVALDPHDAPYFRRTSSFEGFNRAFSGNATTIGIIVTPVSLYLTGLVRKDSKMQRTALLAGEAVADSEILSTVLKDATGRARPSQLSTTGNFGDTWFESQGSRLAGHGGFPSGHAIAAFSVATVVARRYGNHRWVPFAAYGLAALVSFSRVSLSAHFVSDVFIGAALGYSVSRFAVLRQ